MSEVFIVQKEYSIDGEINVDVDVFNNEKDAQKSLDKDVENFLNEHKGIRDMEVEKDSYPYSAYVYATSDDYYLDVNVIKK